MCAAVITTSSATRIANSSEVTLLQALLTSAKHAGEFTLEIYPQCPSDQRASTSHMLSVGCACAKGVIITLKGTSQYKLSSREHTHNPRFYLGLRQALLSELQELEEAS